jgi:hypothetical protein
MDHELISIAEELHLVWLCEFGTLYVGGMTAEKRKGKTKLENKGKVRGDLRTSRPF